MAADTESRETKAKRTKDGSTGSKNVVIQRTMVEYAQTPSVTFATLKVTSQGIVLSEIKCRQNRLLVSNVATKDTWPVAAHEKRHPTWENEGLAQPHSKSILKNPPRVFPEGGNI